MVQPSSVDVRIDRYFRVFENHRYPHIDPSIEQAELTRLVEPDGDEPFILHPASSCSARPTRSCPCPTTCQPIRRQSQLGEARAAHPLDGGLHRRRLLRARDPRAVQRRHPADQAVAGHEDRPAVLLPADQPAEAPYGSGAEGSRYQGQRGPTPSKSFQNFHRTVI
jgi:dCTP deaminase